MPKEPSPSLNNSPRAVLQRLESLQAAGVMTLPKGAAPKGKASATSETAATPNVSQPATIEQAIAPSAAPPSVAPPSVAPQSSIPQQVPGMANNVAQAVVNPPIEKPKKTAFVSMPVEPERIKSADSLEVLRQHVTSCTACGELASTRTQTVFGVGNPNARLCFLGEAPGADEDRLGEPFVGKAGQLLTKIIEACKMTRDEVYILNVLKCRPPGNRNPTTQEVTACAPYLHRQLEMIAPEFVCCLGAVAAQNFLETEQTIGRLRGRVHLHRGLKVVCTYHPAYLLRNPSAKRSTWDDMKLLMSEMGIEL